MKPQALQDAIKAKSLKIRELHEKEWKDPYKPKTMSKEVFLQVKEVETKGKRPNFAIGADNAALSGAAVVAPAISQEILTKLQQDRAAWTLEKDALLKEMREHRESVAEQQDELKDFQSDMAVLRHALEMFSLPDPSMSGSVGGNATGPDNTKILTEITSDMKSLTFGMEVVVSENKKFQDEMKKKLESVASKVSSSPQPPSSDAASSAAALSDLRDELAEMKKILNKMVAQMQSNSSVINNTNGKSNNSNNTNNGTMVAEIAALLEQERNELRRERADLQKERETLKNEILKSLEEERESFQKELQQAFIAEREFLRKEITTTLLSKQLLELAGVTSSIAKMPSNNHVNPPPKQESRASTPALPPVAAPPPSTAPASLPPLPSTPSSHTLDTHASVASTKPVLSPTPASPSKKPPAGKMPEILPKSPALTSSLRKTLQLDQGDSTGDNDAYDDRGNRKLSSFLPTPTTQRKKWGTGSVAGEDSVVDEGDFSVVSKLTTSLDKQATPPTKKDKPKVRVLSLEPHTADKLYEYQRKDRALREFMATQKGLYKPKYSDVKDIKGNKLVFFKKKIYIPEKLREKTIAFYVKKAPADPLTAMAEHCIWPTMEEDVHAFIQSHSPPEDNNNNNEN